MAFVATEAAENGERTLGAVRAVVDPDNVIAEFGIVVRSDLKGSGLGETLMRKMIGYLRSTGTQTLVAVVLDENRRMRSLARRLGFEDRSAGDGTRELRLDLQAPAPL
jgi:acetyltransferase